MRRTNKFECDKTKARSNFDKHAIRFSEGCRIFDGHTLTAPSSQNSAAGEERFLSIGTLSHGVIVVLVWTKRLSHVRVISVRMARQKERDQFHAHIKKATS